MVFISSGRNKWGGLITPRLSKQVRNGVILEIGAWILPRLVTQFAKGGREICLEEPRREGMLSWYSNTARLKPRLVELKLKIRRLEPW